MAISAQLVKQLRDMTGAGMMDCKRALVENDGDIEKSAEYLQVKGIAKAAKKSSRVAAEGLVWTVVSDDGKKALIIEVNCETDFVSRNDEFQTFVADLAGLIAASDAASVAEVAALDWDGRTVEHVTKDTITTIGENIKIRRMTRFEQPEGFVSSYTHAGSQIAVLVSVRVEGDVSPDKEEFGRDVAMHVAAMKPAVLSPDDIDAAVSAKQNSIFAAQVAEEGKPEKIIPRIVEGKMAKWKREQSLVQQAFVKNPDVSVGKLQDDIGGVRIAEFARLEVGEGIEKVEGNLADEVAAQLRGDA